MHRKWLSAALVGAAFMVGRRHGRARAGNSQDRRHRPAVGRRHRLGSRGPARHGDRDRGDQCGRRLQGRRQDLQARAHHVRRPVHRRRRQGRGGAAGQPGQGEVHHRPGRLAARARRHQRHQSGQGHRADQRLRPADPEERHQGPLQLPHLPDQHRVRAAAHQVAQGERAGGQEGRHAGAQRRGRPVGRGRAGRGLSQAGLRGGARAVRARHQGVHAADPAHDGARRSTPSSSTATRRATRA